MTNQLNYHMKLHYSQTPRGLGDGVPRLTTI